MTRQVRLVVWMECLRLKGMFVRHGLKKTSAAYFECDELGYKSLLFFEGRNIISS